MTPIKSLDFFEHSPSPILVLSADMQVLISNLKAVKLANAWSSATLADSGMPAFMPKDFHLKSNFLVVIENINYEISVRNENKFIVLYFTEKSSRIDNASVFTIFAQKTTNAVIITDSQGLTTWVNKSFEQITGYTLEEMKGKKPGDLLQGKEPMQSIKAEFRVLFETNQPFEIEIKNYRKNGQPYWSLMSITPIFGKNGTLESYMALVNDQTEQKESLKKLEVSERSYRTLVETSSNFIYKADYQGYFTFINSVGVLQMGYKKEEILGMKFTELIVPNWRSKVAVFYQNQFLSKTKETYYEFPAVTKSGEIIWLGQTVQMYIEDGWITGFQAIARNITEIKLLENEVEKQKKLLNTILDSLPLVVYLKQRNGDYIFINNSNIDSYKEPIESDRFSFVKHFDYSDNEVWSSKNSLEKIEKVILSKQQKYYIVGKEIIHPESFDQPLLLGYAFDITERKQAEEELRKAKNKVEKSMGAKEKFISIISHEIRTPMNAIVGINNLLMQMPHHAEQREYFMATKTASDNLLKILNNVLDLSKLDAGKVQIENTTFDLQKLIAEVISTFKFKAAEKNIQLNTAIDDLIPNSLKGDALKLHQILVNLVSNAMKFTHEGKVIVKVMMVEKVAEKLILRFAVIDTGIGIAADKLETVFESFSQANSHIVQEYGGTGLGLTIAKSLVELQGGDIEIESTVGVGSKFIFQLPFEPSLMSIQEDEKKIDYNLEGLRILLVEDNAMNQMIVTKFLEKKGVQLYISNHGKEAIEILLQHSVDLILMDLQMPVMDGYETTKYIRKKLKLSVTALPIIAMTAAASSETELKLSKNGFNAMLGKPFDPERMYEIISKFSKLNGRPTTLIAGKENLQIIQGNKISNLTYLRQSAAGSIVFMKNMIDIFLSQTPVYLGEIKNYHQNHNWTKLQAIIHKMKPTIAMMGIDLKTELDEIEESAKNKKNLANIQVLLNSVFTQCEEAIKELEEEVKKL